MTFSLKLDEMCSKQPAVSEAKDCGTIVASEGAVSVALLSVAFAVSFSAGDSTEVEDDDDCEPGKSVHGRTTMVVLAPGVSAAQYVEIDFRLLDR